MREATKLKRTVFLTPATLAWLDGEARKQNISRSELLETILREKYNIT